MDLDQAYLDSVRRVLLVGDLHGNIDAGLRAVQRAAELGADLIVQVGDFGFWPDRGTQYEGSWQRTFEGRVTKACMGAGISLIWIPGNHENWEELDRRRAEEGLDELGLWEHTAALWEAHPGVELLIGGQRWLFVGGAVSVDRHWRTPGVSWFAQERITDEFGATIAAGQRDVDVIVAHDAPSGVPFLYELNAGDRGWPADLIAESDAHQQLMRRILEARLAPGGLWVHGHHHVRCTDQVAGARIEGLGRDGDPIDDLTLLVDLV